MPDKDKSSGILAIVKPGLVLLVITALVSGLLGLVSSVTAEPIEVNRLKARNEAMAAVLPKDSLASFGEEQTVEDGSYKVSSYVKATIAEGDYYIVEAYGLGFGGTIKLFVGIAPDGSISGIKILEHSETPGLGANAEHGKFSDQFAGKTGELTVTKTGAKNSSEIDAITSATITSKAVTAAVNEALGFYRDVLSKGGK